jgi:hypothetical protein
MDTIEAFIKGEASKGKEPMVFDWNKAARLIKAKNAKSASAGLSGDWEWTGGSILEDGKPVSADDTYTFLASTWATPELSIDGEIVDCYLMKSETDGWNSETYWPESALAILNM